MITQNIEQKFKETKEDGYHEDRRRQTPPQRNSKQPQNGGPPPGGGPQPGGGISFSFSLSLRHS